MTDRLLKLSDVEATIGLGHSWIYEKIRAGQFPAPVKLSERCVRWRESEVSAWIAGLSKCEPAGRSDQPGLSPPQ